MTYDEKLNALEEALARMRHRLDEIEASQRIELRGDNRTDFDRINPERPRYERRTRYLH